MTNVKKFPKINYRVIEEMDAEAVKVFNDIARATQGKGYSSSVVALAAAVLAVLSHYYTAEDYLERGLPLEDVDSSLDGLTRVAASIIERHDLISADTINKINGTGETDD